MCAHITHIHEHTHLYITARRLHSLSRIYARWWVYVTKWVQMKRIEINILGFSHEFKIKVIKATPLTMNSSCRLSLFSVYGLYEQSWVRFSTLLCPPERGTWSNRPGWRVQTWEGRKFARWRRCVWSGMGICSSIFYTDSLSDFSCVLRTGASSRRADHRDGAPRASEGKETLDSYIRNT